MSVLDAVPNSLQLQNTCRSESPSRQETHSGPRARCGTGERISLVGLERLEEARRRFGRGDLDASKPDGWKTTSLVNFHILWNVSEKLGFKTWIGSISGAFFGSLRTTFGNISLKHNSFNFSSTSLVQEKQTAHYVSVLWPSSSCLLNSGDKGTESSSRCCTEYLRFDDNCEPNA